MGTTLTAPVSGLVAGITVSGAGLGVGSVVLTEPREGFVKKAVNTAISEANITVDNFRGKWVGSVNVGNEIRVDLGLATPNTRIFTGLITNYFYRQEPGTLHDVLEIRAQDYGKLLKDVTATEDFVNLEVGSIVKSLVAAYTPQITVTNVQNTGKTLAFYACKKRTVFDILNELARTSSFNFYVDTNKDLHFEPITRQQATTSNGDIIRIFSDVQILPITPITTLRLLDYNIGVDSSEMYNQVQVVGDRQLVASAPELKTANGGSVFTLNYKPHNVVPNLLGSNVGPGYIKDLSVIPPSGTKFLVDYNNKQVIMISGTNYGNNVPASGGSILFNYQISRPLIKTTLDYDSQATYGVKEKIINDKAIKDSRYARDLAKAFVAEHRLPVKAGDITVAGVANIDQGQTVTFSLPHLGITDESFRVQEVTYNLNKEALLSQQHLKLNISTRKYNSEDFIHDMVEAIRQLQAGDIDPEDVETFNPVFKEQITIDDKNLKIFTRDVYDSFILNSRQTPPCNILQDIVRPTNQNFETLAAGSVPASWTIAGNANLSAGSDVVKGGSYAARLVGSNATLTSDVFEVKAGSRYLFTGWGAQTNNGSMHWQINFLSGNGAVLGSNIGSVVTGSSALVWRWASGIAPTGATSGTMSFHYYGGTPGSAWFDVCQATPFEGFGLLGDRRSGSTLIYSVASP